MDEFEWVMLRLESLKTAGKEELTLIQYYIEDCLSLCLEKSQFYSIFVNRLKKLTKNENIMGIREILKNEGREEERLKQEAALKEIRLQGEAALMEERTRRIEERTKRIEEHAKRMEQCKKIIVALIKNEPGYSIRKIANMVGSTEYFVRKVKSEVQVG